MRSRDELDLAAGRRPATQRPAKADESSAGVGHALADPKSASVQTMLEVQRLAGNAGVNQLLARDEEEGAGRTARSPVLDVVGQGGGQALDGGLRREMEGRLGADFSDVRLHTDAKATGSAKAVQANAYTVGNDVVVRNDRWSPGSDQGKQTLAHELTHVVQQRAGPVAGTSTGDGISVSDPSDRFERAAEKNATRAMAGSTPSPTSSSTGRATAQLDGDDDVQRLVAQRGAAPEEEEAQMQRDAAPEEEEAAPAQMQRQAPDEDALETA